MTSLTLRHDTSLTSARFFPPAVNYSFKAFFYCCCCYFPPFLQVLSRRRAQRERDLDPLIVYACTLAAFHGRTKEHENMNHARSAKHDTLHSVDAALSGLMLRNTCFGFFFYLWACLLCVSICERMFLCRTCLRAFMKAFTSQAQSLRS